MSKISLKQIYFGGVTIQVPEIWNVETEEYNEADGVTSYGISVSAPGNDLRSFDISFGPMPEDSDAYAEACGTYEEVVDEEDLTANDEPIICFGFKDYKAYGFNVWTDDGLPCFFFCAGIHTGDNTSLLTVLTSAPTNDELQSLIEFVEEYISFQ